MENDHIDVESDDYQQKTDIALEGKKIEIPSPGSESSSPEHSNDTKLEKKKTTRAEMLKNKPKYSQSLVLQMFSHLKTQKQFEEEKKLKIARSDRKHQKIKRELAASCPPVGSSLKSFGSSWTQFRMLRGPQSKLQETHTDTPSDISHADSHADSHHKEQAQLNHSETVQISSGHNAVRIVSVEHADREQPNGRTRDTMGSPEHIQRLRQRQNPAVISSHGLPRSQGYNDSNVASPSNRNNQRQGGRAFSDFHTHSNKGHILKGPGKIQIRLSTCSTSSSRQTSRGQKYNYQWDNMPAGTITSVQPSLITFDGSIL